MASFGQINAYGGDARDHWFCRQPKSTATVRIVGAILVIARFNPLKKFGPITGRTLCQDRDKTGEAGEHLNIAEKLIDETGYHRRDKEVEKLRR